MKRTIRSTAWWSTLFIPFSSVVMMGNAQEEVSASGPVVTGTGTLELTRQVDVWTVADEIVIVPNRGAMNLSDVFSEGRNQLPPWCKFSGEITVGHPAAMHRSDRFYGNSQLLLTALELVVDTVNFDRCGVALPSGNYSLTLSALSDESSMNKTMEVGTELVESADFVLGGFSTNLNIALGPVMQEASRILMAGAALRPGLFEDKDWVFGTLPAGPELFRQAFAALSKQGARSVASVAEAGLKCFNIDGMAKEFGMNYTSGRDVPRKPTMETFLPIIEEIRAENPDVMVTCTFDQSCTEWIRAMRAANYSPPAQLFTVCPGSTGFELATPSKDLAFMLGVAAWHRTVPAYDPITGWTAEQYASIFERTAFQNSTYHAAATASGLSVLIQAMENAQSKEQVDVRRELNNGPFATLLGNMSFDVHGQSTTPYYLLQYDNAGAAALPVYPPEVSTSDIVYPMPPWAKRDCLLASTCAATGGTCQQDGTCSCNPALGVQVGLGEGVNATCKIVPEIEYTFLSAAVIVVGLLFVFLQVGMSITCLIWTRVFRKRPVVRASQPFFLYFIASGCIVLALSILPSAIVAFTGDNGIPRQASADAACMAELWFFWIGFGITFSALLAKVWRVKLIFSGTENVPKKVTPWDVILIMVVVCAVEVAVLLAFQFISPFRWETIPLLEDADGFPLSIAGRCTSSHGWWFEGSLIIGHVVFLLYALHICYITRGIPSKFAEGKWIAAAIVSMSQILLLALPTLILVMNDSSAAYFVKSCLAFSTSATVTALIFFPKMYRHHFMKIEEDESTAS